MREELQKKIDRSIKLIRSIVGDDTVEVAYSGGKDSDVILQLAKESGVKYRAIYKNTTIDPPGTIKHALEMGAEMVRPEKNFFQLMREHGNPSRYYRFCCSKLKEYHYDNSMGKTIIGVRKSESRKRSERYKEPTECLGTKKNPYEAIYPLLEWTDEDVRDFILERGIKCAPVYYDEQGEFHVERRLGCLCCPLQGEKKRQEEFKQYPKILRQYVKNLQAYIDAHPDASFSRLFHNDACMAMVRILHFGHLTSDQFIEQMECGLFDKPDYKAYLEKTYNVNL